MRKFRGVKKLTRQCSFGRIKIAKSMVQEFLNGEALMDIEIFILEYA